MKKTTTLSILILFFAITAFAGPVDPEKALEIANSFWKSAPGASKAPLRLYVGTGISKAPSRNGVSDTDSPYYLFSTDNAAGFVIVSGEESLPSIVGYSTNGYVGEMPPALVDWLADYSNFVDDVRAGIVEPIRTTATVGTRIEPMLQTSWNQSAPYNNYCPEVNGQKTPTGCTATAMAQVMKFHEWPEKPKRAITWDNNITGKTENIDITKNVYKWDKMLAHYRDGYTAEQADAVARLMVDVGKAINSSYSPGGTGSNYVEAARGLVNVFDYSPQIRVLKRNECTYDEFISVIRENLEARQPLVHTGQGQSFAAGHAFVCDGIDENNYVHIDWGWDGAYNGFFDIGSMAPGGTGIGGGQDRYNVDQAIIANIKPRTADEAGRPGDPTLYDYDVVDKNNDNAVVDEYAATYSAGYANFRVLVQFLNWSHSAVNMDFGISITSTDGAYSRFEVSEKKKMPVDDAVGYYVDFKINNQNTASKDYLKEGTYYVEIFYKNSDSEEPVKMKGENNRLVLEVGRSTAKLSKALPDVSVSGFEFRGTVPNFMNDNVSFDVALRNNNTNNALVVVVPIINRVSGDKIVSDTIVSAGELINVFDNTDFLVTYSLGKVLKASGEHYVTFAYDMRNSYIDHNKSVDKSRLKSITGESKRFNIFDLPTAPMPVVTSVTSNNPVFGENLSVAVRILNNSSASAYSGKIGIFVEKDGIKSLFAQGNVEDVKVGGSAVFQYSSKNYIFDLEPGTYNVTVCEMVDGEWADIPSNGNYVFTLQAPTKCLLYTDDRININNGKAVIQGDSIDVIADITCKYGDLDGYVRMNVLNGISMVLRSNYIPVTIANGETVEINLRSLCNKTASLGEWNVNIVYYDKNKRQLGTLIINDVDFPGNGVFYIHDETSVDDLQAGSVSVVAGNGCITVEGAAAVKVLCLDGRTLYSGNAASVAVENGVYVVVVEGTDGNVVVKKVLVK
ncbi:MAG: hypothetical protein E7093_00990 [Bacteroidales bacterium]|nr:hypothetical protein [Bacteroidales bacterium]